MKRALAFIALSSLLLACNEEKKPEEKPAAATTSTAASPAAGTATGEVAAADTDDIPTESDFEDEAELQITSANLETELDALEKEIGE